MTKEIGLIGFGAMGKPIFQERGLLSSLNPNSTVERRRA
jgi:3-hydroxyisobutyrate dehydrogenase-like beta-hydroxyacid dehydrogenase